ncbi:hypothetical protein EV424DRAFT_1344935 [Suillus variegatus]|nr:hypothetical protein EV424DRAFT_1344935 [Suillus variegatus]
MASILPPALNSPPRQSLEQCFHVEKNVVFRIQLSSSGELRGINDAKDIQIGLDCQQIQQNRNLVDRGTQTTVSNGQSIDGEAELRFVKEQLRNADNNVAYLSDRVTTYRDRWLEEYYRTNNLEFHMPSDIHVAVLPQIPVGAPSPTFFPGYSDGNDGYLE